MDVKLSVPELVKKAQADAKICAAKISAATSATDKQREIENLSSICVDIFTGFEARMQHHFKRGPFSRKLSTLLKQEGRKDLSERVQLYYLAVNVLKHGKGASYRELRAIEPAFLINTSEDDSRSGTSTNALIDVTTAGFFDGLSKTLLEAFEFLHKR